MNILINTLYWLFWAHVVIAFVRAFYILRFVLSRYDELRGGYFDTYKKYFDVICQVLGRKLAYTIIFTGLFGACLFPRRYVMRKAKEFVEKFKNK